MKYIIFTLSLVVFLGCSKTSSIKNTKWEYSSKEGTSTLAFSDSTYTCTIEYGDITNSKNGTYKYVHPNLMMKMNGNVLNAFIEEKIMTTKEEYPIIFKKQ